MFISDHFKKGLSGFDHLMKLMKGMIIIVQLTSISLSFSSSFSFSACSFISFSDTVGSCLALEVSSVASDFSALAFDEQNL